MAALFVVAGGILAISGVFFLTMIAILRVGMWIESVIIPVLRSLSMVEAGMTMTFVGFALFGVGYSTLKIKEKQ